MKLGHAKRCRAGRDIILSTQAMKMRPAYSGFVLSLWRKALVRVTAARPSNEFPLLIYITGYIIRCAADRTLCSIPQCYHSVINLQSQLDVFCGNFKRHKQHYHTEMHLSLSCLHSSAIDSPAFMQALHRYLPLQNPKLELGHVTRQWTRQ